MSQTQVPPELARIAAFVNTIDRETGIDHIAAPDELKAWLVEHHGLAKSVRVTGEDVDQARALREGLRQVLRDDRDRDGDAGEIGELNRLLRSLRLHVQFNPDGKPMVAPVEADGVDGAFGAMVAGIAIAVGAGTWSRLKVCASDTCQWAFYDHSRNRSGRWCSMRVCGNRSKIRTYRSGRAPG